MLAVVTSKRATSYGYVQPKGSFTIKRIVFDSNALSIALIKERAKRNVVENNAKNNIAFII